MIKLVNISFSSGGKNILIVFLLHYCSFIEVDLDTLKGNKDLLWLNSHQRRSGDKSCDPFPQIGATESYDGDTGRMQRNVWLLELNSTSYIHDVHFTTTWIKKLSVWSSKNEPKTTLIFCNYINEATLRYQNYRTFLQKNWRLRAIYRLT